MLFYVELPPAEEEEEEEDEHLDKMDQIRRVREEAENLTEEQIKTLTEYATWKLGYQFSRHGLYHRVQDLGGPMYYFTHLEREVILTYFDNWFIFKRCLDYSESQECNCDPEAPIKRPYY